MAHSLATELQFAYPDHRPYGPFRMLMLDLRSGRVATFWEHKNDAGNKYKEVVTEPYWHYFGELPPGVMESDALEKELFDER